MISLSEILHTIAQALMIPCLIILIILMAGAVWQIGDIVVEYIAERRKHKCNVPQLLRDVHAAGADGLAELIENSGLLRRQKKALLELAESRGLPKDTLTALAERLLATEEARNARTTSITDMIAKLGPMFGLLGTLIDKALDYLSEQQLSSGGFLKYGDEDVEEDAAVLEMLATLGISLTDERFTKDGHTVLDGMMGWYQDFYFEDAKTSEPKQGFYHEDGWWRYEESRGWYRKGWIQMRDPNDPNHKGAVPNRIYDNAEPYSGLCAVRGIGGNGAKIDNLPANNGVKTSAIDYKALLQQETDTVYEKIESGWYGDGSETIVSASSITGYSRQVLALKRAQGEFTDEEKEELWTVLERKIGISNEYYMGRKSGVYSPGVVRAITALDMDPADVGGLDFLAPLTNVGSKSIGDLPEMLKDLDAVDASVWRSRGVDADSLVDMYASRMLENQTASGKFSPDGSSWEEVQFTAENVAALAPHTDKEYIAKAIDKAIEYLSSVQLADGSFPGRDGQPDGEATLAVLDMMNAAGISLDDDRFVKNGNTVADGLRTFYIEGVGFVSKTEVESSVDGLSDIPSYENPVMDFSSAVSALTYLQAAENGKFGPDGKGNSVFEIVGSALTETPLGAILLAVVIVALLAFGMVRRYDFTFYSQEGNDGFGSDIGWTCPSGSQLTQEIWAWQGHTDKPALATLELHANSSQEDYWGAATFTWWYESDFVTPEEVYEGEWGLTANGEYSGVLMLDMTRTGGKRYTPGETERIIHDGFIVQVPMAFEDYTYLSVDKGQHGSYLPIQMEPDTVIYFYPW